MNVRSPDARCSRLPRPSLSLKRRSRSSGRETTRGGSRLAVVQATRSSGQDAVGRICAVGYEQEARNRASVAESRNKRALIQGVSERRA